MSRRTTYNEKPGWAVSNSKGLEDSGRFGSYLSHHHVSGSCRTRGNVQIKHVFQGEGNVLFGMTLTLTLLDLLPFTRHILNAH